MTLPGFLGSDVVERVRILLTVLVALAIAWPAWENSLLFADDAHLAYESRHFGFWGPTSAFVDQWGFYRIGYTILLSPVYALSEDLWIVKLIGVLVHVGTAILARRLWRRLGGRNISGTLLLISVLFYPFALEAIVWPATIAEYAFGPFVLLFGTNVAIRGRPLSALYGGVLMGFSLLLHEQLLVPLVVLVLILLKRFGIDHQRRHLSLGVGVIGGLAAILVLISFGSNARLSGPAGPSLRNVLDHLPYITAELRRSTPFGDLFWSTTGLRLPGALIAAGLGVMVALAWLINGSRDTDSRGLAFSLSATGSAAVAWWGAVLPIISSGVPWHTPRVMYIPAIAMAFLLCGIFESVGHAGVSGRIRWIGGSLIVTWAAWGAASLGAEADAFRQQLEINHQRLELLVAAIEPSRDLSDTSLLVIAGFPGTDVQRPFFGEHIIGITSGELRAKLGLRVYQPSPKPSFDFRSGWAGLCRHPGGRLGLLPEWVEADQLEVPADGASYMIWLEGAWQVQRGSETIARFEQLDLILPECPNE